MKIGVLGSGTMGNGIALTFANAGLEVVLYDIDSEKLTQASETIRESLTRIFKKKNKDLSEVNNIIANIKFTIDKNALSDSNVIIEAIVENMEIKKKVFAELDAICDEKTIIASNTSGLSITELAAVTDRADRIIGMHFFNPVPIMKLVELIRGAETSNGTYERAKELVNLIGKESISVLDAPLFIVNRILVPMLNEAMFVFGEGIATAEDIDRGMVLGANHPIGPLALADLIGLDTLLFVAETLFQETGDSKYRVPPILKKQVRAGNLGRKSGKGFYEYN